MAYFDFVTRGTAVGYGLVSQGYMYSIDNTENVETTRTLTATGDTRYFIRVSLISGSASYTPYCKVQMNGTDLVTLTGTTGNTENVQTADVFVKDGDTLTVKIRSYRTGSNNRIWVSK